MRPRIAIDAMGGDVGVRVMVAGAALARHRHEDFQFLFVGDETRIKAALANHPNLSAASEILHAEEIVSADAKHSQALRNSKQTTMVMTIAAIKSSKVSATLIAAKLGQLIAI